MPTLVTDQIVRMSLQGDREARAIIDAMAHKMTRMFMGIDVSLNPAGIDKAYSNMIKLQQRIQSAAVFREVQPPTTWRQSISRVLAGQIAERPPTDAEQLLARVRGVRLGDKGQEIRSGYPMIPKILGISFAVKLATEAVTAFTKSGANLVAVEQGFIGVSGGVDKANERMRAFSGILKVAAIKDVQMFATALSASGLEKFGSHAKLADSALNAVGQDIIRIGRLRGMDPDEVLKRLTSGVEAGQAQQIGDIVPGFNLNDARKKWLDKRDMDSEDLEDMGPGQKQALDWQLITEAVEKYKKAVGASRLEAADALSTIAPKFADIKDATIKAIAETKEFQDAMRSLSKAAAELAPKVARGAELTMGALSSVVSSPIGSDAAIIAAGAYAGSRLGAPFGMSVPGAIAGGVAAGGYVAISHASSEFEHGPLFGKIESGDSRALQDAQQGYRDASAAGDKVAAAKFRAAIDQMTIAVLEATKRMGNANTPSVGP